MRVALHDLGFLNNPQKVDAEQLMAMELAPSSPVTVNTPVLGPLASNWRLSGIVNVRSGSRLTARWTSSPVTGQPPPPPSRR